MPRSVLVADDLSPAPGARSYAVRAGGWVFSPGMLGVARTGEIVGADPGGAAP